MFNVVKKSIQWGEETLTLETGKIARQADSTVIATYGETSVLAAVCFAKKEKEGQSFFPLTVNYQEKYYAAGKIPGGFFKREARPTEKETLTAVMEARAKATSVNIDASKLTAESIQKFQAAQSGISGALGKLMMVSERYPDLKANQNFLKLQDELASTENQILTARTRFNESVKPYNTHIKTFPNSIFAGMFGFQEKAYFNAVEGADKPVEVKF